MSTSDFEPRGPGSIRWDKHTFDDSYDKMPVLGPYKIDMKGLLGLYHDSIVIYGTHVNETSGYKKGRWCVLDAIPPEGVDREKYAQTLLDLVNLRMQEYE